MPVIISAIPTSLREKMRGVSWHEDPRCPPFDELALLEVPYIDFDGAKKIGQVVIAQSFAQSLARVFECIYRARFPIGQMRPIEAYGGDDAESMNANNCSGFNFRTIAETDRLSQHALGLAVDINPVQNPWVRDDVVLPLQGREFLDRGTDKPGLIRRPGPVTDAFDAEGWTWGGDWTETKDYHHFVAPS